MEDNDEEALYGGNITGRRLRGVKINPIYQECDVRRGGSEGDGDHSNPQSEGALPVGEIQIEMYESLPRNKDRPICQRNSEPIMAIPLSSSHASTQHCLHHHRAFSTKLQHHQRLHCRQEVPHPELQQPLCCHQDLSHQNLRRSDSEPVARPNSSLLNIHHSPWTFFKEFPQARPREPLRGVFDAVEPYSVPSVLNKESLQIADPGDLSSPMSGLTVTTVDKGVDHADLPANEYFETEADVVCGTDTCETKVDSASIPVTPRSPESPTSNRPVPYVEPIVNFVLADTNFLNVGRILSQRVISFGNHILPYPMSSDNHHYLCTFDRDEKWRHLHDLEKKPVLQDSKDDAFHLHTKHTLLGQEKCSDPGTCHCLPCQLQLKARPFDAASVLSQPSSCLVTPTETSYAESCVSKLFALKSVQCKLETCFEKSTDADFKPRDEENCIKLKHPFHVGSLLEQSCPCACHMTELEQELMAGKAKDVETEVMVARNDNNSNNTNDVTLNKNYNRSVAETGLPGYDGSNTMCLEPRDGTTCENNHLEYKECSLPDQEQNNNSILCNQNRNIHSNPRVVANTLTSKLVKDASEPTSPNQGVVNVALNSLLSADHVQHSPCVLCKSGLCGYSLITEEPNNNYPGGYDNNILSYCERCTLAVQVPHESLGCRNDTICPDYALNASTAEVCPDACDPTDTVVPQCQVAEVSLNDAEKGQATSDYVMASASLTFDPDLIQMTPGLCFCHLCSSRDFFHVPPDDAILLRADELNTADNLRSYLQKVQHHFLAYEGLDSISTTDENLEGIVPSSDSERYPSLGEAYPGRNVDVSKTGELDRNKKNTAVISKGGLFGKRKKTSANKVHVSSKVASPANAQKTKGKSKKKDSEKKSKKASAVSIEEIEVLEEDISSSAHGDSKDFSDVCGNGKLSIIHVDGISCDDPSFDMIIPDDVYEEENHYTSRRRRQRLEEEEFKVSNNESSLRDRIIKTVIVTLIFLFFVGLFIGITIHFNGGTKKDDSTGTGSQLSASGSALYGGSVGVK